MTDEQVNSEQERVEVIDSTSNSRDAWIPIVGSETLDLLNRINIPEDSRSNVRQEALNIMSRCIPPTSTNTQRTGLVVGYVQSGKTISFTTVAALACDNNFSIVIVIAGTSTPLMEQSRLRLRRDLGIDQRNRNWLHIHNPTINDQSIIQQALEDRNDPNVPDSEKRILLLTVMKHYTHLDNLTLVLSRIDLNASPTIVIDDEADQAGLNTLVSQDDQSTTYECLINLKDVIPNHTFLEYTATPQGPLLINMIDVLSPEFAVTLTPGEGYVGGEEFFLNTNDLVIHIPEDEIFSLNDNIPTEPPDSLISALRIFYLGIASGIARGESANGNRSMMIHPSRQTIGHDIYHRWVEDIKNNWEAMLNNSGSDEYRELYDDFKPSYDELNRTVTDLEDYDLIFSQLLKYALRRTHIHLVNASGGYTPQIDWDSNYSNILVGGQAMDRGFTVEGLTVTYMPRGVGARTADTIQQRGRFFGYKRSYINYCRVFIEGEVSDMYTAYVRHENNVHRLLVSCLQEGNSLSDLRRAFILDRRLNPTRRSILDRDFTRINFNDRWFFPRAPHDTHEYCLSNKTSVEEFIQQYDFVPDNGHPDRTDTQKHIVSSNVPLQQMYDLLGCLHYARIEDSQSLLGLLAMLDEYLDNNPSAVSDIYIMSSGRTRKRSLNAEGIIPNIFQGAYPVNPPENRGTVYRGDRHIHSANNITMQIHMLRIVGADQSGNQVDIGPITPTIAIWIPDNIHADVYIQDQGPLPDLDYE